MEPVDDFRLPASAGALNKSGIIRIAEQAFKALPKEKPGFEEYLWQEI